MEGNSLSCQVCVFTYRKLLYFQTHVHSKDHKQKMKEVFLEDVRKGGNIPFISVVNSRAMSEMKAPIVGLSMLSLCFSLHRETFFYLCHICEEKCEPFRILNHLSSGDHYINYFNYTNPDVLNFSWMPSRERGDVLGSQHKQEMKERGSGTLQMLELPQSLIKKLEISTYSEVMHTLNENEKLRKLLEATKSERKMIQTYQRDKSRKHPLLGMQHLVECICVGPPEKRYYLCTLCKLTFTEHMIIKHVLSFDHIFSYFKVWHPSTLLSKECYREYTFYFASMMRNLAKQTEEIHATANTDMKEVNLSPAEFLSVNFKSYLEALKRLESIVKENKQCTLITSIKPGNKLEYHPEKTKTPEETKTLKETKTPKEAKAKPARYKLWCQDCSFVYDNIFQYKRHLTERRHSKVLTKFCRGDEAAYGFDQKESCMPHLGLYTIIGSGLKQNKPVIGASLIVTCISTQVQTDNIYVCFACKDCFLEETIEQHLNCEKHLILTLLYQNPWRLPFAWEDKVDVDLLKSMAWKEENERGPDQRLMKILDLPDFMFQSLMPPSYPKVMDRLQLYHTLLKNQVPHCETYSKLKENERFPLLGKQFLVMHDLITSQETLEMGYLCLLCKRTLSDAEFYAHVFSREHVAAFLDRFHQGSQTPITDAETLLDLATQAGRIHSIAHVQKIKLDIPIREPYSYRTATGILTSVKRRTGGGPLTPPITPKMKLTPKKTLGNVADISQQCTTKEGSKDQSSQKTTDNNKNVPEKISGGLNSEIAKKCSVSPTSTDEMKPAGREPCHLMKEEKEEIDVSIDDEAQVGKEGNTMYNCVPTHVKSYLCERNERKRARTISEKSQDDKGSDKQMVLEMGCKRPRCTSEQDASAEQSQKIPSDELKGVTTADTGGSGASSYKTIKKEGSCVSFERQCDGGDSAHLSKSSSVKATQKKKILSHVTGSADQRMHLMVSINLPTPLTEQQRKEVKHLATLWDQDQGQLQVLGTDGDSKVSMTQLSSVPASTYVVAQNTSRCTTTKSRETNSTSTASTTKSAPVPKLQECKTEAAPKVTASSSCKAAPTGSSTVVRQVTSRRSSSETESKITVTSETTVTISANDVAKATVQHKNTQVSKAVPLCHKINLPAAPHQTMVRPEHKSPSTEPSHIFTTKMKPIERPPKVGISSIITVTCRGKQKLYCQLCAVKLKKSDHLYDDPRHKYNYVKNMLPKVHVRPEEESKLDFLVGLLLEVEKTNGSPKGKTIEVTNDEYIALGALSDYEGLKRVEQMLEEKNMHATSPLATAQALRQKAALFAPYEVTSPDYEMYMQQNEVSGLSTKNQPIQLQIQEMKSNQTIESDSDPQHVAVSVKQERVRQYVEAHAQVPVSSTIQSPAAHGCADLPVTQSESVDSFAQIPYPCQEAPEDGQQQERRDPRTQDTENTSPGTPHSPTPFSSAAVVKTEQQHQSGCSLEAEHIYKPLRSSGGPEQHKAVGMHPKISVGERIQGSSDLSKYLSVKKLEPIGLGDVWECKGPSKTSFFLCESCREKLSLKTICQHLTSTDHMVKYISRAYPQHLNFWQCEDVTQEQKEFILKGVAEKLYQRESHNRIDAQGVALEMNLYECVRTAPFSEALEMVQNIGKADKVSVLCPSTNIPQQTDTPSEEKWESQEEPLPMEESETDQTSDQEARHNTDEQNLEEETAVAGHLDEDKHGTVWSPLHVTSASSNADSVVLPFLGDTDLRHRKTCKSPSIQPDPGPPDTQHPVPIIKVEQAEIQEEPPSMVSQKTMQTLLVSLTDKSLVPRKRPAETSVEALLRSCTDNPQLSEPTPAKYTRSSQQQDYEPRSEPVYKSSSVDSNATSTTLPQDNKGTGSEPYADEECTQLVDLIAQMREDRSEVKVFLCKPDPNEAESESGVESTLDSKCELVKATAKSDGTILSAASTADPSEPKTQSVSTETISGNVSQLKPRYTDCAVTSHNTEQVLQPQGNMQTETSGVDHLPINTIITVGSNPTNQQRDGSKEQKHTEGHSGYQVAQSSTDTSNPSNTQTYSAGCFQYSQMCPVKNGNSHHLSTAAVAGHPSPDNPADTPGCVDLAAQQQLWQQQQEQWQYQQQQLYQYQHLQIQRQQQQQQQQLQLQQQQQLQQQEQQLEPHQQQQLYQYQQQQLYQYQQQQLYQYQQQQLYQYQQQQLQRQQQLQLQQQQQLQHQQQQQLYQYQYQQLHPHQQMQMWQYQQQPQP